MELQDIMEYLRRCPRAINAHYLGFLVAFTFTTSFAKNELCE